jgi:hypothetical protein
VVKGESGDTGIISFTVLQQQTLIGQKAKSGDYVQLTGHNIRAHGLATFSLHDKMNYLALALYAFYRDSQIEPLVTIFYLK